MAVIQQVVTDRYALYHGDCCEVIPKMPDNSVHLTVYSPPFGGLYHYSSSERDLSNCAGPKQFMEHYEFVVRETMRIMMPGRVCAVHCMDIPKKGANIGGLMDLPGEIIRLHEKVGLEYIARHHVWKEPLAVRNQTMSKGLAHKQIVEDSALCSVASADYLLLFRKRGDNPVPIAHPNGLLDYAGSRVMPAELLQYRGYEGNQVLNKYSHWIWRQYASAFWDDVRIERVLPYKEARGEEDERHVHPLQLDVIERVIVLRSNPGEIVFTPFMGVGSEVYGAVINGRKGVGVELKETYYNQAVRNVEDGVKNGRGGEQLELIPDAPLELV